MRFLPFVWQHLRRNGIRTGSTALAMALSVFLLCTLQSVLARLDRVVETRSPRRLVVRNAVSPMYVLPLSYAEQIRRVPGVRRVAATTMFGGLLAARRGSEAAGTAPRKWSNVFGNVAVDAEAYLAMSPELKVAPEELREFMRDLRGCLIGRDLAGKLGWTVGDRFFLESISPAFRKPSGPFEFVVRGLIDPDPRFPDAETDFMLFHFRYLDEGVGGVIGSGAYAVEIEDPARAGEVSAAIDAVFENASHQTLTETEQAAVADLMSLFFHLAALVDGIGLAVCFTILLVTANTMSMAVRERRTEIAVLKTLGFRSGQVMGFVVAEGLLLGAMGGALGTAGARAALWALDAATTGTWAGFTGVSLSPRVALLGFGVAVLLGFAAGLAPAWGAYRARVTEMLRTL